MNQTSSTVPSVPDSIWLARFAQFVCWATLFLIFAGALVTSTGSGLSVPDWPLSYGQFFPPMVAGVFYEHGHRLIAGMLLLMTLTLAIWLGLREQRRWVRLLGYCALGTVLAQAALGGITVLFYLPKPVSIGHAVLGQTFLILTIVIAYSQSRACRRRTTDNAAQPAGQDRHLFKAAMAVALLIYLQLIAGALLRHTYSGLAIHDFPYATGRIVPAFDQQMLTETNDWRRRMALEHDMGWLRVRKLEHDFTLTQMAIHFTHRVGAVLVSLAMFAFVWLIFCARRGNSQLRKLVLLHDGLLIVQWTLAAYTIWSLKDPQLTSGHVVVGAALLGVATLICLQSYQRETS